MQSLPAYQLLELGVLRAGAKPGLDPGWLALDRDLAVARLDAEQASAVRG
jgi:hypothetical protein